METHQLDVRRLAAGAPIEPSAAAPARRPGRTRVTGVPGCGRGWRIG